MMSNPERQQLARALFKLYDQTSTRGEFMREAFKLDALPADTDAALIWECIEEATEHANEYHARVASAARDARFVGTR